MADYWNLPRDWQSPRWREAGRVHDWRNYVSDDVRSMWDTFNDDQKKALAVQAQNIADAEEWE